MNNYARICLLGKRCYNDLFHCIGGSISALVDSFIFNIFRKCSKEPLTWLK